PVDLLEAHLAEGALGAQVVAERLEAHDLQPQGVEGVGQQRVHRLRAVARRPVRALADDDAERGHVAAHVVELGGADEVAALVEDAEGGAVGAPGVGLQQALEEPQRHAVRGRAVEVRDLRVAEVALQAAPVGVGQLVQRPQRHPPERRSHGPESTPYRAPALRRRVRARCARRARRALRYTARQRTSFSASAFGGGARSAERERWKVEAAPPRSPASSSPTSSAASGPPSAAWCWARGGWSRTCCSPPWRAATCSSRACRGWARRAWCMPSPTPPSSPTPASSSPPT